MRSRSLVPAALLVLSGPLLGQTVRQPTHSLTNAIHPSLSGGFGQGLTEIADFDGDGVPDYAVAAPNADVGGQQYHGRVYLHSGRTTAVLQTFDGDAIVTDFGKSLAHLGDVNNDGTPDLAVGARLHDGGAGNGGRVYAFDGATGQVLWTVDGGSVNGYLGQAMGTFGTPGATDGLDLLVGEPGHNGTFSDEGRVVFLDGKTGASLGYAEGGFAFRQLGGTVGTRAGSGALYASSVNGDVYSIAPPNGGNSAITLEFLADPTHNDFTPIHLWKKPGAGYWVALSYFRANRNGRIGNGGLDIVAPTGGTTLMSLEGENDLAMLGISVALVPDVDGDGEEELAYTAGPGGGLNRLRIVDLQGNVVEDTYSPGQIFDPLVALPDVSGDGRADWVQSNTQDARVYLMAEGLTLASSNQVGNAFTATFDIDLGSSHAGEPFVQVYGISGSAPGVPGRRVVVPRPAERGRLHDHVPGDGFEPESGGPRCDRLPGRQRAGHHEPVAARQRPVRPDPDDDRGRVERSERHLEHGVGEPDRSRVLVSERFRMARRVPFTPA